MNAEKIESILSELKVNSKGAIRGKNKVIDKIHSEHLIDIHEKQMAIRVYVAKLSTSYSTKEALKMIDEFIYQQQIKSTNSDLTRG